MTETKKDFMGMKIKTDSTMSESEIRLETKTDEQCDCKGIIAMPPDHSCKYTRCGELRLINKVYFDELPILESELKEKDQVIERLKAKLNLYINNCEASLLEKIQTENSDLESKLKIAVEALEKIIENQYSGGDIRVAVNALTKIRGGV